MKRGCRAARRAVWSPQWGLRLVDAAPGTDTGGSVRGPTACCGVIGFKPTSGRVSRHGVVPRDTTLDCIGPFEGDMNTIIDVVLAIDPSVQVGRARRNGAHARITLVEVEADLAVKRAVTSAVLRSGPSSHHVVPGSMHDALAAGLTIINAERWLAFGHLVKRGCLLLASRVVFAQPPTRLPQTLKAQKPSAAPSPVKSSAFCNRRTYSSFRHCRHSQSESMKRARAYR